MQAEAPKARLVRVMPNTPALVGEGMSALCAGASVTAADRRRALEIFSAVGRAVEVASESLLDAVTGLSGSGPAFVFLFLEALSDGGVQAGLPRPLANELAAQTVLGAAKLALTSGTHLGALKDMVTSPGGTTIAGVAALESGAFRGTVIRAIEAAANRSKELSNG
jgi:pyrroline-5-carboxylate reductase